MSMPYLKSTSTKALTEILPRFLLGLSLILTSTAPAHAEFYIAPIAGLTTEWHPAPYVSSIPLGMKVEFKKRIHKHVKLRWIGADEVRDDGEWSVATYRLDTPGLRSVTAESAHPNGTTTRESCVLTVVDISVDQIHVSPIDISVAPIVLDEDDLNTSTFKYYRWRSIASLQRVEGDRYVTSVRRTVNLDVAVSPPGFAPLIEWRYRAGSEYWTRLGTTVRVAPAQPGVHIITAGPDANRISLETYSVEITSHESNEDIVQEGMPVTFKAVTDPSGFEEVVTWLASTKYGTSDPVMGQGPEFTVRFEDTWGAHRGSDRPFQWLGVKADNAVFNQDQKGGPPPRPVDENDPCTLFDQTAALVEGTITKIEYTFHSRRGPREEITFSNLTTHFGNEVVPDLVIRTMRGPLPDETFLDPTELPRFIGNATYLLYLRNTKWFYSPVLEAFRVEHVGTAEVLIDQGGYALNPRPTINAFEVGQAPNPNSPVVPLSLKRIFDSTLHLEDEHGPQPLLPGVNELTVGNAHDRSSYLAAVIDQAEMCDGPFTGVFNPWPDATRIWDLISMDLLDDPAPVTSPLACGQVDPGTGEIRLCN